MVNNLFFYLHLFGEKLWESFWVKNWKQSENQPTLTHQVRDKRPKVRSRILVWQVEIRREGEFFERKISETGNCRSAKNDELSLSFSLENSNFRAWRIKKAISRLKGETPEMQQRINQSLEPPGEKWKSSGTKERLLKCSSLKRITAEVLSRSALESIVG